MKKTQILTQNNAQNDPIDHRIMSSSFRDFKDEFRHLRNNFSQFPPQNLTFKHSLAAEIDLEDKENKIFKD